MLVNDILLRINQHFDDNSNGIFTEAEKISWIDACQKDLARRLPANELQELIDTDVSSIQYTVAEGSYGFLLPHKVAGTDNFIRVVSMSYGATNNRKECRIIRPDQRKMIGKSLDCLITAEEPLAIIRGDTAELFLTGSPGAGAGIEVTYITKPATVTAGTDIIQLKNHTELIFVYAQFQGYAKDAAPEARAYDMLYTAKIAEIWQRNNFKGG